jgi:exopolysaccharide biosynthesis polyprenyl glycosylphosphotransferase
MQRAQRDFVVDVLMLVAAGLAVVVSASAEGPPASLGWSILFIGFALLMLAALHIYRPRFAPRFFEDVGTIFAATAIATMAITFLRVLFTDNPDAAGQAVRGWLFAAVYLIAGRAGTRLVDARRRQRGEDRERTLIVGAGRVGHLVARRLLERPEFGLQPVAFYDHDPLEMSAEPELPIDGVGALTGDSPTEAADAVEEVLRARGITRVIVTFSLSSHAVELALVRRCEELGVSVSLVPRLFEGLPDETELERLGGLPLVTVFPRDPRGWQFAIKYAVDRVVAAILLVFLSPLLLVATIGILITMGRPLLFRQDRVGMDGRAFGILKFRTMHEGGPDPERDHFAPAPGEAPGGVEGVDRRTRFGALLRSTSIDELPQLINVVRGEMSLIGPRPERVEYVRSFDQTVHRYADRTRVKSGITGWAQVHGLRGKTSLADRVEWDNYYIENWSAWLDIKILFLTVLAVFRAAE